MDPTTISLLALVMSIVSFWLSYKSYRINKLLSAAERKTQIHSLLIEALIESQELHRLITTAINHASRLQLMLPEKIDEIQKLLEVSIESIQIRLSEIRDVSNEDPIRLERFKVTANEVLARTKQISPMIKELRLTPIIPGSA